MPSEIVDMMYTIGPMPMEDEEFLRVLEVAGKCVEEKKRDHKTGDSNSYKNNDEKSEKKEKKHNKDKKEKHEKKEKLKNNETVQKKDQKKKRDYKFETVKEGLKGMCEDMITKHKDAKANCWRCGREGHYTLEYYAKRTEDGEEIVMAAVSSARKTRRSEDDAVSSTTEKNPKVAAVETTAKEEKRIWEVEGENEDFWFASRQAPARPECISGLKRTPADEPSAGTLDIKRRRQAIQPSPVLQSRSVAASKSSYPKPPEPKGGEDR
jgi:hypothetical protein